MTFGRVERLFDDNRDLRIQSQYSSEHDRIDQVLTIKLKKICI